MRTILKIRGPRETFFFQENENVNKMKRKFEYLTKNTEQCSRKNLDEISGLDRYYQAYQYTICVHYNFTRKYSDFFFHPIELIQCLNVKLETKISSSVEVEYHMLIAKICL